MRAGGGRRPELRCAGQGERLDEGPLRRCGGRGRHIDAGRGPRPVGVRRVGAVVGARLQDLGRDRFAELDALGLGGTVGNGGKVGRKGGFHLVLGLRIDAGEHRSRGCRRRGFFRGGRRRRKLHQIGPVLAIDRVDGVEHGELRHGDDPLGRRRQHLVADDEIERLVVPVADDVGGCRPGQAKQRDGDQSIAIIGVHARLSC